MFTRIDDASMMSWFSVFLVWLVAQCETPPTRIRIACISGLAVLAEAATSSDISGSAAVETKKPSSAPRHPHHHHRIPATGCVEPPKIATVFADDNGIGVGSSSSGGSRGRSPRKRQLKYYLSVGLVVRQEAPFIQEWAEHYLAEVKTNLIYK
jgi:hypothetical protein